MQQLEFDLGLDPAMRYEIDIGVLYNKLEVLRKSHFARTHALEKQIEEQKLDIEYLKRELEALKICG